jgi:tetratricopeptide (TPR) repeat protein
MMHPSKLNKRGVFQINEGSYDDAVTTLTKALKTVKLAMPIDTSLDDTTCSNAESPSNDFHCEFVSKTGRSSFLVRSIENGRICQSSIFRDPIHISGSLSVLESFERLSYVVLYNLALAYHLKATEEPVQRLQIFNLQKALRLYEHAHHVLMNQDHDMSLLHTMAITNNLGHIHHVLGDEDRAGLCFQHLLSTIIYMVDYGEAEEIKPFDGFFRNAMTVIAKSSSAPAA